MFKIPEDMKSKYAFVTLAAKRAEQLQMGAAPRTHISSNKVTVVAQAEVAAGLVQPYDPEQAQSEGLEADVEEEE